MLKFTGLAWFLYVAAAWSQSPLDATVAVAEAELARVRSLVEAGALPRASLEQAQEAVADAQDASILRRVAANGPDLNVVEADEMMAAVNRRLARRQKLFDDALQLVNAGAAARASLQSLAEDLAQDRREAVLAATRARLIHEIADMAAVEAAESTHAEPVDSTFLSSNYAKVEKAYRLRFGKSMPVSAMGQTAVHRAMGFDHRGRVDVALNPDQPEGVWLVEYLKQNHIPFFAFRGPVKGKATGAHIHIGPMSTHLAPGA